MANKDATAAGYGSEKTELVRATCLYAATKLGDLMDDLVIVGGLAPSLLIDQQALPAGADAHVGTMDLDVGLAVAILEEDRYHELAGRLRRAGFSPDANAGGNVTRQRWKIQAAERVTLDFLIAPSRPDDRGGEIRNIESDFGAIIAPGLHLAFEDRQRVSLAGETIMGETASRDVWVCGPGAFVVLKALAFRLRGENKDAYDLYYVLRNYGSGLQDVMDRFQSFVDDDFATEALAVLEADFSEQNAIGPRRVAEFLSSGPDDVVQADVVGFVSDAVRMITETRSDQP